MRDRGQRGERGGEREGEKLGFSLLVTAVDKGMEYSLLEVGISWRQGFTFLPCLEVGFQPTLSALWGLSGFIQLLVAWLWNTARTGLWLSEELAMTSFSLVFRHPVTT